MVESILVIETTIDDMSSEVIGYVLERALAAGALDAYTTPAQMKKQRSGVVVTLLSRPDTRDALVDLLLRETTTLGVRIAAVERVVLERHSSTVETEFGPIAIKVATGAGFSKAAPEYEDCRAAALRNGVPLREVFSAALSAWEKAPR